jgi:hypothetical protein
MKPNKPDQNSDSLNLPVFDVPQMDPPGEPMPWARVMEETRAVREHYMKHHDSPERRLADKNPQRFVL